MTRLQSWIDILTHYMEVSSPEMDPKDRAVIILDYKSLKQIRDLLVKYQELKEGKK